MIFLNERFIIFFKQYYVIEINRWNKKKIAKKKT